jgi:hypothetical protein
LHILWTTLLGFAALLWIAESIELALGVRSIPSLEESAPLADAGVALECKAPPAYALTYPIGALIFAWMLTQSAIVTLWQGGVTWRGTFYPLEELKRGVV